MNISTICIFVLSDIPAPVVLVRRTKNTVTVEGLIDEHIYNVYFCFVRYFCPFGSCKKSEEHTVTVERSVK